MKKLRSTYASLVFLAITLAFFCVGLRLVDDFFGGGHPWKQGDWLINSLQQPVRRSFSGDFFISISDWAGVSPLFVTVVAQSLILLSLAVAVGAIFFKNWSNTAFLILLLSPAFFPVFWAVDTKGSMRKEILAYASFSALFILSLNPIFRRSLLAISIILFSVATLSHEGMVFFAPVFMFFLAVLAENDRLINSELYLSLSVVILVSMAALTLAFFRNSVDDYFLVCNPLLERGMDENICSGAIRALERDMNQNSGYIMERTSIRKLVHLVLAYTLSFASVFFFLWHTNASRRIYIMTIVTGIAFLPLYFLGVDWGRWLNFHLTSIIFLFSLLLSLGKLEVRKEANMVLVLALSFLNLFWAVEHTDPFRQGGLPQEASDALSSLF